MFEKRNAIDLDLALHPFDTEEEIAEKLRAKCAYDDFDSMVENLRSAKVQFREPRDINSGDVDAYIYSDVLEWLEKSYIRKLLKELLGDFRLGRCEFLTMREYAHPREGQAVGLNNCFFKTNETITCDELRFRSRSEVAIYWELRKRQLLFFPNAAAVLGGDKPLKREPDFLVCQSSKWGILEVMGESYHTSSTATKDHDRARLFKEHGILCVEFFRADLCRAAPAQVVDKFLAILARH